MSSNDSLNVLLSDSDWDDNYVVPAGPQQVLPAGQAYVPVVLPSSSLSGTFALSNSDRTYVLPAMPSASSQSSTIFAEIPNEDTELADTVDPISMFPSLRSKFMGVRVPPGETDVFIDPDQGPQHRIQRNVINHVPPVQRIATPAPIAPPLNAATGLPARQYLNADSTNRPFHAAVTPFTFQSRVRVRYETRTQPPDMDIAMPLRDARRLAAAHAQDAGYAGPYDHSIYRPGTTARQETHQQFLNPTRPFQDTWGSYFYHSWDHDPNNFIQANRTVGLNVPQTRRHFFPWIDVIRDSRIQPGYSTWYLLKLKMEGDQSVGNYDGHQDMTIGAVFPGTQIPIPMPGRDVEWYRVVKMPDYLMYNNWEEATLFLVEQLYRERYFLYENYANRYEETACNYHTPGQTPLFKIIEAHPLFTGAATAPQYFLPRDLNTVWGWRLRYGDQFLLRSELLEKMTHYAPLQSGTCILDYITLVLQENTKTITKADVYAQFKDVCPIGYDPKDGVSFWNMCDWAKKYAKHFDLYAIHLVTGEVMKHRRTTTTTRLYKTLVFIIANFHCYPVSLPYFSKVIQNKDKVHFTEFKWHMNTTSIGHAKNYTMTQLIQGNVKEKLILFEQNLQYIALLVMAETMHYLDHMQWKVHLVQFKYPLKELVYAVKAPYHDERVEACKVLDPWYPGHFEFRNQSLVQIAFELFHIKFGEFPKSEHSQMEFEQYQTLPLMGCFSVALVQKLIQEEEPIHRIDKSLAYGSTAMEMPEIGWDYPVFEYFDEWVPFEDTWDEFVIAEYFVDGFSVPFGVGNTLDIGPQIWNYTCVECLLEMHLITPDQILYIRKASKRHKTRIFSNFAKHIYEIFGLEKGKKMAKLLLNMFIGVLNHNNNKDKYTSTVMNIHDVISFLEDFQKEHEPNETVRVASFTIPKELAKEEMAIYQLERIIQYPLWQTHAPIWRQIIGIWNIKLLQQALHMHRQGHLVLGFRTDCIYFVKAKTSTIAVPGAFTLPEGWHYEETLDNLTAYEKIPRFEQKKYPEIPELTIPDWDYHTREDLLEMDPMDQNMLVTGVGGSGKSHLLLQMVAKVLEKEFYILSPTHAALNRLRESNIPEDRFKTVASFFKTLQENPTESLFADILFIDEVSMLQKKDLYKIIKWWRQSKAKIWFFGDFSQCYPVEGSQNYKLLCDINIFIKMIQNKCDLEYQSQYGRYDQKTYDILHDFLHKNILAPTRILKDYTLKKYICYLNKTRYMINAKFTPFRFVHRKKQRVRIWDFVVGQQVIANLPKEKVAALAKENIINNAFYTVTEIRQEMLCTKEFPQGFPVWYFEPTWAVTVYKIQGQTLHEPYCILDLYHFTKDMFYTALTRCATWDQIHILGSMGKNLQIWHYPESLVSFTKLLKVTFTNDENEIMYWYNWRGAAQYIARKQLPGGVLSVHTQPKKQIEHRVTKIKEVSDRYQFWFRGIKNGKAQRIYVRMKYSAHSKKKQFSRITQKRKRIIQCLESNTFDYEEIIKTLKETYTVNKEYVSVE